MATWGFETATSTSVKKHQSLAARQPVYVMSRVIDYTLFTVGSTDTVQALLIPDNSIVLTAGIEVLTADSAGNSGTISLGNYGETDVDNYVTAAAPTTVGQMAVLQADATAVPFVVTGTGTKDTIDVTHATGNVNCIIRVWALVADLDALPNSNSTVATTSAVLS